MPCNRGPGTSVDTLTCAASQCCTLVWDHPAQQCGGWLACDTWRAAWGRRTPHRSAQGAGLERPTSLPASPAAAKFGGAARGGPSPCLPRRGRRGGRGGGGRGRPAGGMAGAQPPSGAARPGRCRIQGGPRAVRGHLGPPRRRAARVNGPGGPPGGRAARQAGRRADEARCQAPCPSAVCFSFITKQQSWQPLQGAPHCTQSCSVLTAGIRCATWCKGRRGSTGAQQLAKHAAFHAAAGAWGLPPATTACAIHGSASSIQK